VAALAIRGLGYRTGVEDVYVRLFVTTHDMVAGAREFPYKRFGFRLVEFASEGIDSYLQVIMVTGATDRLMTILHRRQSNMKS
jgi:hypothetical protein